MSFRHLTLTEAVATGAGAIPTLVERLRTTEEKRREVTASLEAAQNGLTARVDDDRASDEGRGLADWRSRLSDDDVTEAREGLNALLTMPILFTPCIQRGYRAIRFEGRLEASAIFSGVVTNLASPVCASWNQLHGWLRAVDGLRRAA